MSCVYSFVKKERGFLIKLLRHLSKLVKYLSKQDSFGRWLRLSFFGMLVFIAWGFFQFFANTLFLRVAGPENLLYYFGEWASIPAFLIYFVLLAIPSVVFSIINLVKKKEKLFPIIVLITSIVIIISSCIFFWYFLKNMNHIEIIWNNFIKG